MHTARLEVPIVHRWLDFAWWARTEIERETQNESLRSIYCIIMAQIRGKMAIQFGLIKAYKKKFGDLKIPCNYVIPKNKHWDKEFHGFKIGRHTSMIRQYIQSDPTYYSSEDVTSLVKEGFVLNVNKEKGEKIIQSVQWYKQMYGDCQIPEYFVVPEGDSDWPEHLQGFGIGAAVQDIRQYKHHKSIHEELTALGVNLRHKTAIKKVNLTVFEIYLSIHGNLRIPRDFLVPIFDPKWPQVYWGFELGKHTFI